MNGKSLLQKWSSVSAAAAMLIGSSRASATKGDPAVIDKNVSSDGDPYEPLVLKPPNVKVIPEALFAGHTSHSSHASHASHASHYSGSGSSQTYPSYSPPGYSPAPSHFVPNAPAAPRAIPPVRPAPTVVPAIRIELTNGTVVYGTLLTKSAGGITFTSSDGNTYKVERRYLTPNTLAALGLPPEQAATSQAPSPSPTTENPSDAATRQKLADLEQTIATLRSDNEALRQQQLATKSPATPSPTSRPPSVPNSKVPQNNSQAFWLDASGRRHTARCRYYGTGRGQRCGPNDGVPCKVCGG